MSDDAAYLDHMAGTIRRIEASQVANSGARLVAGTDQTDATLFRLSTLGESVKHLSPELKEAHPEIPWREITGFRDHLAHNVLSLNMGTVQDVVANDLPDLGKVVRQELDLARCVDRGDDVGLGL